MDNVLQSQYNLMIFMYMKSQFLLPRKFRRDDKSIYTRENHKNKLGMLNLAKMCLHRL